MKFIRSCWYDIGLIPLVISLVYLCVKWGDLSVLKRLALMNYVVIFWHQFEEYRFPGGEPAILNMAFQPSDKGPADRYPLNQNNAMIINLAAAYIVYFLPVVFPEVMWIGFMPVVFGMSQVIVHVIITPKKIGNKIYTPGTCAVLLGHVPVGIYWLYYTISNGMLDLVNVIGGVVYLGLFIGLFMRKVSYGFLSQPDSPYVFGADEMERGGYAERIRRLNAQK